MKKIFISIFYILLFIANCTPSVERYKNKARKELQKENSAKAIEYLQMAFEESLDDEFYPVGRRHNYSSLYFSANRNKLVLAENQPSKSKAYFTVYEVAKEDDWTRRVKGFIRNVGLSPNGIYSIINIEDAPDICRLELWDLQKKEQLSFSRSVSCSENAGVSDAGQVIFTDSNNIVMSYDLKADKLDEKYIIDDLKPPMKNIPARGSFQFSPGNILYFTYGSMGLYHLFYVKDRKMNLISKDGAFGKIYFLPGSDNPGLITGGANAHQVNFFNASSAAYEQYKTFPIRYWKDAVFISDKEYYFVEDNRLVYVNQEKENKLSFWASVLSADASGKVYFLSPLGKLMAYNHMEPKENSKSIFQLGWEIK
ncbi:MAG: hypothetical protein OEV78_00280 [Spirochaetia bacterium]|nr:hypothetical protein [Spirochaetia bacterium]